MKITKPKVLEYFSTGLMVLCALIIFWPPADPALRYKSVTTWYVTQGDMVPFEKAFAEANALISQAQELSQKGELTLDRLFEIQKRMEWIDSHAEQYGPNPRPGKIFWGFQMKGQLAGIRGDDKKFQKLSSEEVHRYSERFDTDPEYLAIKQFRASNTTSNWPVVTTRYIQRYMASIPIGTFICLLLMVRDGQKFPHALGIAFNHRWKMMFYPIGILWVLLGVGWEDYKEGARQAVSWLSYATAASVSLFFGGVASAQTVKKDEKKKSSAYALQLDSRVVAPIGDMPPFLFNRTTLNAKNWLVESISTATPETKSWSNETGFGVKVLHTPNTAVNFMGIESSDSMGTHKVIAGMQYFRSGSLATIAVPVIRLEKTLGGPLAFAVAPNPIFRLGREGTLNRLALSPDVNVRKTVGKPLAWTAGLGFNFFHRKGKGDRIEAALLRNSIQQWQLRGRYVLNFAF